MLNQKSDSGHKQKMEEGGPNQSLHHVAKKIKHIWVVGEGDQSIHWFFTSSPFLSLFLAWALDNTPDICDLTLDFEIGKLYSFEHRIIWVDDALTLPI